MQTVAKNQMQVKILYYVGKTMGQKIEKQWARVKATGNEAFSATIKAMGEWVDWKKRNNKLHN